MIDLYSNSARRSVRWGPRGAGVGARLPPGDVVRLDIRNYTTMLRCGTQSRRPALRSDSFARTAPDVGPIEITSAIPKAFLRAIRRRSFEDVGMGIISAATLFENVRQRAPLRLSLSHYIDALRYRPAFEPASTWPRLAT